MDPEAAPLFDRILHARAEVLLRAAVRDDLARVAEEGLTPRETIRGRVRAIPEGWVRTYGDLSPGAPRLTGHVLKHAEDLGLPWHRVVRADGSLAMGERQGALLAAEGVPLDRRGRVVLRVARLPPDDLDLA